MKTPEEIKDGLSFCSKAHSKVCGECPYQYGNVECIVSMVKDALAYVQQLEQRLVETNKTSPRWISVKERLPEERGYYLVACESEDTPRILYFRGKTWSVSQSHYHVPEYWMELPLQPGEDA